MIWFWQWKPKIEREISGYKLKAEIVAKYPDIDIILRDRIYEIPADPWDVIWKMTPNDFIYVKEKRDCEDAVRISRGWLSKKGYGNLVAADCRIEKPGEAHALIGFWYKGEILLGEPQWGKIVEKPGWRVDRLIL